MMTFQELSEKIKYSTLEKDVQYFEETGERPMGYKDWEFELIKEYCERW